VDLYESTRREKRQSFFVAIALAAAVMILAAPVVQAAVQSVKVANTPSVKLKDTAGGRINSEPVGPMGITGVTGSSGAVDVRVYAGGTGVLGLGDCSTTDADGFTNVVAVPGGKVVTAFILTGTGTVTMTSEALTQNQPVPLSKFHVDSANPNFALTLPEGLGTTAPLTFTANAGAPGDCSFVVLGQDLDNAS
jgi:hypothetical protein